MTINTRSRDKPLVDMRQLEAALQQVREQKKMQVQDIDTEEDWRIAEMKYRILNEK